MNRFSPPINRIGCRRGTASVEVVMSTAVAFMLVAPLFIAGVRACQNLGHIMITLVGWPYL